jgi:hypothetical protein
LFLLLELSKRARNLLCCSGCRDTSSSNADVSIAEHPLRSPLAPAISVFIVGITDNGKLNVERRNDLW